jgi:hypothetical protein
MRIEVRNCIHCGEEKPIPQPEKFSRNICKECRNKRSNDYNTKKALENGRRPGTTGRRPYPLRDGYKTTGNLFKVMSTKTFKCKTKEEWRELMRERLDEVFKNDELSNWIFSHSGDDDKPKRVTQIKRDYPNTKGITWEEYEKGLGDNEVDS